MLIEYLLLSLALLGGGTAFGVLILTRGDTRSDDEPREDRRK